MSTRMLHFLASQTLPFRVEGASEVDEVYILVLGGHVKAEFARPPPAGVAGEAPSAVVSEITRLGRRVARRFPSPSEDG